MTVLDDAMNTPGLYTGAAIEVYTGTLSASAHDKVSIHVSTTARAFDLRVTRFGTQNELVWAQEGLPGEYHPTPERAWEAGCAWPVSATVTVAPEWRSGLYLVTAVTAADDDGPSEEFLAFFVVRAVTPTAPTLIVLSTNTYAAYNGYGGGSFYESTSQGQIMEHKISMRRPWMPGTLTKPDSYDIFEPLSGRDDRDAFGRQIPALSLAAGFHIWERVMVEWLERNGYDVDYAINSDLEHHPELVGGYRLMLSVGHDEYWSWGMRDTVESFIESGGNVCFFSANVACWQVRMHDEAMALTCYKVDHVNHDPVHGTPERHLTATLWSNATVGRPESRMSGLSFWYAGFSRFHSVAPLGPGGYLIYRPEHWMFEGTGLKYGDCLGQASTILHYELDGCPIRMEQGLPYPETFHDADASLVILGMAPASLELADFDLFGCSISEFFEKFGPSDPVEVDYLSANHGHAVMGMYVNNGTVFAAGTTDWTNGLKGADPAVEQITRNLIDCLSV